MSDATKVTPKTGLSTSKKAKALLIALVNLNIIFALVVFKAADVTIAGQMITAILFLAGDRSGWITGTTLPIDGGVLAGRSPALQPEAAAAAA